MGLHSDPIFQALKRVRDDNGRALNEAAIAYAYKQRWISEWESKFYLSTWRKRKLTGKQQAKRLEINARVLQRVQAHTPKR